MTSTAEIVERLRSASGLVKNDGRENGYEPGEILGAWLIEAADHIETLARERDRAVEALREIDQWSKAYPTTVFPELSDEQLRVAHRVLQENGMTLDALSASAMRHCMKGVGEIARRTLSDIDTESEPER